MQLHIDCLSLPVLRKGRVMIGHWRPEVDSSSKRKYELDLNSERYRDELSIGLTHLSWEIEDCFFFFCKNHG